MNPNPLHIPEPEAPVRDARYWARRLLVCNPFFLASAALLLLGVNRLSVDPGFLGDERRKLLFNFGALEAYALLVIGTALVLRRRRIWYDSALLVTLDHGLAAVPFLLLSQAALLDLALGWKLTVGGGLALLARAFVVRARYPQYHLPGRALALGALFLGVNATLPLLFHSIVQATSVVDWVGPDRWIWRLVLPALAASANLLPRPRRYGGLPPERHWLPLFVLGLWLAGTGVHAWSISYLAQLPLTGVQLTPLAWVAAWTLWNRFGDFVPRPPVAVRQALLAVAALVPALAREEPVLVLSLTALNASAYLALWLGFRALSRPAAVVLLATAATVAVSGLPNGWVEAHFPGHSRWELLPLALGLLFLWLAFRLPLPETGFLAALVVGYGVSHLVDERSGNLALLVAGAFLMAHAPWWPTRPTTPGARAVLTVLWLAGCTAAGWTPDHRTQTGLLVAGLVILVSRWAAGRRPDRPPGASGYVSGFGSLAVPPLRLLFTGAAPGIAALAASLVLFAGGVAVAWRRPRWERDDSGPDGKKNVPPGAPTVASGA